MARYSSELLKYIVRKLGGQPDAVVSGFQQLPEVVRDNWLAAFGDINLPDKNYTRRSVRLRGNTISDYNNNVAGEFIPPHINQYTGRQAPPIIKTRSNPTPETILHEGIHNLDNALYSVQYPSELEHDKSFFLPTFRNLGEDVTVGTPRLDTFNGKSAPLQAFKENYLGDDILAGKALKFDPHGDDYYKNAGDIDWEKVSQEGVAQMLSNPLNFRSSKPYIAAVEAIEQNPLTKYDITFDNLIRENSNIFENEPVFVTRKGKRLRPKENSVYVNMLRNIPEEGIKPIDIKETQIKRYPGYKRSNARGQGSTHWQSLNENDLIKMIKRRAYITDEGRRLLDELDRASKVSIDDARVGGLYNE